jgi:type I restriction enzyme S subunit
MSLSFKFIPLTFLNDENEIKKQIRNTIILKYFFGRNSKTVHLEDLITGTQYGYNASALVQGRNKFLRISDITDGKVNWETVPYCNCTDEKTYLLFPNDILIARTGGTTGKSFLISEPPALSIYAGYLIRIRANIETNPDYLNLFLNSYVYWSQIVSLNEDNFRPSVNAEKLKKLILPKCDPSTQNDAVKISNGEIINGYDDLYQLIDETLLKYDKLKEIQVEKRNQYELQKLLKNSFIQEAIQGKLTDKWRLENPNVEPAEKLITRINNNKATKEKSNSKKFKIKPITLNKLPFSLPTNWVWSSIPDILNKSNGSIRRGPFGSSLKIDMFEPKSEKTTKIYEQKNAIRKDYSLGDYYISTDKYPNLKSFLAGPGDILISCAGTIGEIYKLPEEAPIGIINQALLKVNLNNEIILDKFFILMFQGQLKNQVNSDAKGSAMKNMGSVKYLQSELIFGLPPFDEQKKIIEEYELIYNKCQVLEEEIRKTERQSNQLMQAVLKEAFEVNNINDSLDALFEDINYNLYVAMINKQIENRLRINYGEVATQKTVFNINAFTDQKIPYNFINSNHGTFSPQLKEDLSKNNYLTKDRKGNGEVFIIKPSKEKEVLEALSNSKNKQFVRAVNGVLDIYELPFINKETDKIELLNTVAKLIIDYKTSDLEKIYTGMQNWEIKQNGFKTKAEKFTKTDTRKMIGLIDNLGLVDKLKKFI